MNNILIVMPSYYEYESILVLKDRLFETIKKIKEISFSSIKIIIVDDTGGADRRLDILSAFDDKCKFEVIRTPFNVGHQRAIVFGLRSLKNRVTALDILVTMDADGEDNPEDLLKLLKPIIEEPSNLQKIVLAQRSKRNDAWLFIFLYRCFQLMFVFFTGHYVRTGNYVAFRGWALDHLIDHPYFDMCYSSTFLSLNIPADYIACDKGKRIQGISKMNYQKLISHGLRMLIPFIDKITVRYFKMIVCFSLILLCLLPLALFYTIPKLVVIFFLVLLLIMMLGLVNFVILFFLFYQAQGLFLRGIENK